MCRYLHSISVAEDDSFDLKSTPGWENCVNVGGPQGKQRGKQRPRILDYKTGLQQVRDYLKEGLSKRHYYVKNAARWLRGQITWPTRKGREPPGDDDNQLPVAAGKV